MIIPFKVKELLNVKYVSILSIAKSWILPSKDLSQTANIGAEYAYYLSKIGINWIVNEFESPKIQRVFSFLNDGILDQFMNKIMGDSKISFPYNTDLSTDGIDININLFNTMTALFSKKH